VDILVNNAALVPTKPADEELRNRHYDYFTTSVPANRWVSQLALPTTVGSVGGVLTYMSYSTARARRSRSWNPRNTARSSTLPQLEASR
jgi:hypothetical protein